MSGVFLIPKVINYCWFGGRPLPVSVKNNISSWRKYCPECKIVEWNEKNFDVNVNSFVSEAYSAKKWAFVSDFARLNVIYQNGGIYFDTDVEIIRNIERLFENRVFVALQRQDLLCNTGLGFGAEPQNIVIKKMLEEYSNKDFSLASREKILCPILNTHSLKLLGYKKPNGDEITRINSLTVYPPKYFDPLSPGFTDDLLSNETFTIHHYDASWEKPSRKLKRGLINKVGQSRINSIKQFLKKYNIC